MHLERENSGDETRFNISISALAFVVAPRDTGKMKEARLNAVCVYRSGFQGTSAPQRKQELSKERSASPRVEEWQRMKQSLSQLCFRLLSGSAIWDFY